MTKEEIVAYLESEAPVPTGKDDFKSVAATVARHLFPYVNAHSSYVVANWMQERWIPRFRTADDDTHERLFTTVEHERKAYDRERADKAAHDGAAAERADSRNRARSKAKRRAAEAAKKDSKAEQAKRIGDLIGCDRSYCYVIIDKGTSNPVYQARLAKAFGNQPSDWQSKKKRRATPISNLLDKRHIDGCSVWDYVRSNPEIDGDAGELKTALDEAYMSGGLIEPHYSAFDAFRKDARSLGFAVIEVAEEFWFRYRLWRAEKLSRVHIDEIEADYFG